MLSQAILLSALAVLAEARFGQEQVPIPAISALSNLGQSGEAATLAGGDISTLLAAANPCAKLQAGDAILANLGTSAAAVAAARGLVGAEQNFNPFVVSVPTICSDPTLPANPLLRGVVPLVDPAVVGSDLENANANKSLTSPFPADGLSVAQVMVNAGFSNFTTTALDGTTGVAPGASAAGASGSSSGAAVGTSSASSSVAAAVASTAPSTVTTATSTSTDPDEDDCDDEETSSAVAAASTAVVVGPSSSVECGGTTMVTVTVTSASVAATSPAAISVATTVAASSAATSSAVATTAAGSSSVSTPGGTFNSVTGFIPNGVTPSTIAGLDFGLCTPTMKFEAGLDGRSDTEFTFQAIDPLVNKGQEEALNPNIITNRICDQLTNVCNANAAAKTACANAKTTISNLGTKDVTTAEAWNTALGFAGTNTNPDNAPQPGLVGHD